MRVNFFDSDYASEIDLIPESVEEAAFLLRMTSNVKAIKPEIRTNFAGKEINCSLWIKKIQKSVQKNSIANSK